MKFKTSTGPSISQLAGLPTQVTRYNTGIERTTQIPMTIPTLLSMPKPIQPTTVAQTEMEKLTQVIKDVNNPIIRQAKQEELAESVLNATDNLQAIEKGLTQLKALNIKDPAILEKISKLEERAAAHRIAKGETPVLAGRTAAIRGARERRATAMSDKLKETSAAATESQREGAAAAQEYQDDIQDRTNLLGIRPSDTDFSAADTDALRFRSNLYPDREVTDKTSPNFGLNPRDELLNAVWGGGSTYVVRGGPGANATFQANAQAMQDSVTEAQLDDFIQLGTMGKTFPNSKAAPFVAAADQQMHDATGRIGSRQQLAGGVP